MSDELKAAANRFADYDLADFQGPTGDCADIRAGIALSRYVLADLAAREAEERERALPIDAEWLRPLCRSVSVQEAFWFIDEDVFLVRWACGFNLKMDDRTIADHATRGDLLDLLAGLKIHPKGGAE